MRAAWLGLIAVCAAASAVRGQGAAVEAPEGIAVWEIGSGPTTVIVLHGGPAVTHRYLRPEWDTLSDAARVIYYDQRGCGASERTDSVTWEMLVSDLHAIVWSAKSSGPVILAGSSWGTSLALTYAKTHPGMVEALVLSGIPSVEVGFPRLSTPAWLDGQDSDEFVKRITHRSDGSRDTIWVRVADVDITRWPAVRDSAEVANGRSNLHPTIAKRLGMACPRTGASIGRSMRRTGPLPDSLYTVEEFTLILRGPQVPQGVGDGSMRIDSILPHSSIATIPKSGHDPWLERPSLFFNQVRVFLLEHGLLPEGYHIPPLVPDSVALASAVVAEAVKSPDLLQLRPPTFPTRWEAMLHLEFSKANLSPPDATPDIWWMHLSHSEIRYDADTAFVDVYIDTCRKDDGRRLEGIATRYTFLPNDGAWELQRVQPGIMGSGSCMPEGPGQPLRASRADSLALAKAVSAVASLGRQGRIGLKPLPPESPTAWEHMLHRELMKGQLPTVKAPLHWTQLRASRVFTAENRVLVVVRDAACYGYDEPRLYSHVFEHEFRHDDGSWEHVDSTMKLSGSGSCHETGPKPEATP